MKLSIEEFREECDHRDSRAVIYQFWCTMKENEQLKAKVSSLESEAKSSEVVTEWDADDLGELQDAIPKIKADAIRKAVDHLPAYTAFIKAEYVAATPTKSLHAYADELEAYGELDKGDK